jgi:hypothetical protein
MNRATSRTFSSELVHASQALAEFFAGVILIEAEDGTLQQVGQAATIQPPASIEADLLEATALEGAEFDLDDSEVLSEVLSDSEALEEFESQVPEPPEPPSERQVLVSLAQLRQWYAVARSRGQHDRLPRIQALGVLFKRSFGDADPEVPKPFVGWSAEEIQWWLADCNSSLSSVGDQVALTARQLSS